MRSPAWSMATATTAGGGVGFERRRGARWLVAAGLLALGLVLVQLLALSGSRVESGSFSLERFVPDFPGSGQAATPSEREIAERVASAPVGFVANQGQAPASVSHLAQGLGYAFAFGRDGVRVSLVKQSEAARAAKGAAAAGALSVGLEFVGANPDAKVELAGPAGGRVDYLVGERARWRAGLATQPVLVYRDLWPGIDMAFKGSGGKLKYEFRLAPGADPGKIQLAYSGAQSLSLTSAGALQLQTERGALRDAAPVSYQRQNGSRVPVESSFALGNGNHYGFTTGAYDQSRPLVIDPGLEYSTYLGGAAFDTGLGIAIKGDDAFVTGGTPSPNFPVTASAVQPTKAGPAPPDPQAQDAFVSRIDTTKSGAAALEYSTFLGGSGPDAGFSIDLKGDDAFVTGATFSPDFPTTANAYDRSFNGPPGGSDGYVARIDTKKAGLAGFEYSTYLGGASSDRGLGIDVKGDNAYLTGIAGSSDFPTTANAYDRSQNGGEDAFVTQLDTHRAGAAGLRYSTFLGDSANDSGRGITVEGSHAFVTGPTQSPNFPVTGHAFDPTDNPGEDGFVSRLDTKRSGVTGLRYSTYLGGGADDSGRGIAVNGNDAFVTGVTSSSDFPVTAGAFQRTHAGSPGSIDAFVSRLDTRGLFGQGSGLEYSTYLGGGGPEDFGGTAGGIAVKGDDAFVTGATFSSDFPTTANAFDTSFNGPPGTADAWVSRLNTKRAGRASLRYSTFLGGSNQDLGRGIAVRGEDAYVSGASASADFPTSPNAFDTSLNDPGFGDVIVTRLETTK
jgi:hypothetical protein